MGNTVPHRRGSLSAPRTRGNGWTPCIQQFLADITADITPDDDAAADPWQLTTVLERIDHVWAPGPASGPLPGVVVRCWEPTEKWFDTHVRPVRLALQRCPDRFFVTPVVVLWSAWPRRAPQQRHDRLRTVLMILDKQERNLVLVEVVGAGDADYQDAWYECEFIDYFRCRDRWFDGLPTDADPGGRIREVMPDFDRDPETPLAVIACLCHRFGLHADPAVASGLLRDAVATDPALAVRLGNWSRHVATTTDATELLRRIAIGSPAPSLYPRHFAALVAVQAARTKRDARPGWASVSEKLRIVIGDDSIPRSTTILCFHSAMLRPDVPLVWPAPQPAEWLVILLVGFGDPWSTLRDTLESIEVPGTAHSVMAIADQCGGSSSYFDVMQHEHWQDRFDLLLFRDTDLLALRTSTLTSLWPRLVDHTNVGALRYLDVRAQETEDWPSLLTTEDVHPHVLRISTPYNGNPDNAYGPLLRLLLYHQTPWHRAHATGLVQLNVVPLVHVGSTSNACVQHPRGGVLSYTCASAVAQTEAEGIIREWQHNTHTQLE